MFQKLNKPWKLKGRAKHPVKVHVWAAISQSGASRIVLFNGIMNATRYTAILDQGLLPLLKKFPISHCFQQTTTLNTQVIILKNTLRGALTGGGFHQRVQI